jgi:hypothetical protein
MASERMYLGQATDQGTSFIIPFCFQKYSFFELFEHLVNISIFCAFLRILKRHVLHKQLFSLIPPEFSRIFIALEFTTIYNLYMQSS